MSTRKIFTSPLVVLGISLATVSGAQTAGPAAKAAKETSKETAQVGPFEVAPHWSRYDYPKSVKEGQAFHMVVKGDTLWDIAGRYLGNPYLWPQIWEANGYIKKARLIYPGDPVFLPSVQLAEAAVTTPEPVLEATRAAGPEAVKVQEWTDLDALINVATSDTVRYAGYISASIEDESLKIKGMEAEAGTGIERMTAGPREYLYLNRGASSGLKAGDTYIVNRRSRTIKHPVTGKKVGYRIETVGVARIVLVGENSARATVEASAQEIEVGDYLRPFTELPAALVKRRVVVEGGDMSLEGNRSGGYVVDINDDARSSATGGTVGLDVGAGAGLSVGKVITVYRQSDRSDSVTKRALAAAVVVAVRENFSVARLVYSREEILIGDRVMVQP